MRIGIDLGGTKTEVIALADDGTTLLRQRVASPRDDYPATLRTVSELVRDTERRLRCRGTVGIGIPGAVSPATGLIKNANSTWLNGRPLKRDLAVALERPVRLANDANCFALSEVRDGAAAGAAVVFAVIIGTGTGAGIAVDGRVLTGANAIAGEWGHNPLPWPLETERPGPDCYCGRQGCIETWLSGPALARDHGGGLSAETIVSAAARGDDAAASCLQRYQERMARALAAVINVLDPDVIVLGGGMSNIDSLYTTVPSLWQRHVFSDHVATRLVRHHHGDSSGVRGAAWLWPPQNA